jgi:20S proteasome subunit alpha 4
LIAGFSTTNKPRIFQTEPSGACSEWKATALGKSSKQVKDFLEKHWVENLSQEEALKLTTKALMDVVESGNKNIELCLVTEQNCQFLTEDQISQLLL